MLRVNELRKEYRDFSLNCSFELKSGQITGLVGANGAGKSTAFKAVLGLISADGGEITILGKDVNSFTAEDRASIGVVLSNSGFSGCLMIKDIIPVLAQLYKGFERDWFLAQLKRFGLPLNKRLKDFSTGMKAKLKLLIAISHGASLLILDEPTAGLDVVARDELLSLLREYMEQGEDRAILISSHISSDLESLCDDIYMIDKGKIILHEDTDTLLSEYALLKPSEDQYAALDKQYLLCTKKEPYGYSCLTDQAQYYRENYPALTAERGSIDNVITMMIKGEE